MTSFSSIVSTLNSGMLPRRLGKFNVSSGNKKLTDSGELGIYGATCPSTVTAINSGILSNGLGKFRLRLLLESTALLSSNSSLRSSFSLGESWVLQECKVGVLAAHVKNLSFISAVPQCKPMLRNDQSNFGGPLTWSRRWRLKAKGDPEEGESDEELFWEKEEGKQKLRDIEDMVELIAEAENLRNSNSGSGGPGKSTSEEIEKDRAENLARTARKQAEQRKQAEIMFGMGQRAYGRGVYDKSVELFEAALSNIPASSNLGGEIQIWLAMAYEAHNRHGDCIALYKKIEASHPSKEIRRQAANLRYILEAPKLKISKEEMVSIPIIERDYDRGSKTWSQKVRDRRRKPMPVAKSKDYLEDWLVWDPPRWERNPYFWVAVTVWLTLVGVSLMFQD